MRDRYDVIVVGASVAGSTLAALLGDSGTRCCCLIAHSSEHDAFDAFFRRAGLEASRRRRRPTPALARVAPVIR